MSDFSHEKNFQEFREKMYIQYKSAYYVVTSIQMYFYSPLDGMLVHHKG